MKKLVLGVILLAIPVLGAQEDKPLPQESQVKILKAVRTLQQIQMQMSDLQSQARQLQIYMENECVTAAKASNVDLTKFNCDVDKLTFVPKPPKKSGREEGRKEAVADGQSGGSSVRFRGWGGEFLLARLCTNRRVPLARDGPYHELGRRGSCCTQPMIPLTNSGGQTPPGESPPSSHEPRAGIQRTLIIVPAYNEAGSLPGLLRSLRVECPACDVVVIDDGSTDGTRQCVDDLARVISLPCNLGIGGAVQTGLQVALREDYDCALQVDGDGQHPPREIRKLLDALRESGCDMVVGSRFRAAGGFKSTATRRMGIRFFSLILSLICGTKITDPTSGFRVYNRRGIRLLAKTYSEDFPGSGGAGCGAPGRIADFGDSGGDVGADGGKIEHRQFQIADLHGESAARDFHDFDTKA